MSFLDERGRAGRYITGGGIDIVVEVYDHLRSIVGTAACLHHLDLCFVIRYNPKRKP